MPQMLRNMERDIGPGAVRVFLLAYGGREFLVRAARFESRAAEGPAEAWMHKHYAGERLTIPKGPAATSARIAWTIFTHLVEGWSLSRIAAATGSHTRTISKRKKLFLALGILPDAPASTSLHQETKRC